MATHPSKEVTEPATGRLTITTWTNVARPGEADKHHTVDAGHPYIFAQPTRPRSGSSFDRDRGQGSFLTSPLERARPARERDAIARSL